MTELNSASVPKPVSTPEPRALPAYKSKKTQERVTHLVSHLLLLAGALLMVVPFILDALDFAESAWENLCIPSPVDSRPGRLSQLRQYVDGPAV